jgi:hypothetical protein
VKEGTPAISSVAIAIGQGNGRRHRSSCPREKEDAARERDQAKDEEGLGLKLFSFSLDLVKIAIEVRRLIQDLLNQWRKDISPHGGFPFYISGETSSDRSMLNEGVRHRAANNMARDRNGENVAARYFSIDLETKGTMLNRKIIPTLPT